MEQPEFTQKPSRRLLWIGIIAVVVVIAVIAAVSFMMMNTTKEQAGTTASPAASTEPTVATKEEVTQNLETLNSSIEQASKDQAAAKSAIKDSASQVKVGN
jgi:flagellar basal body-associated protein FliL